jgi:hypothetical protein
MAITKKEDIDQVFTSILVKLKLVCSKMPCLFFRKKLFSSEIYLLQPRKMTSGKIYKFRGSKFIIFYIMFNQILLETIFNRVATLLAFGLFVVQPLEWAKDLDTSTLIVLTAWRLLSKRTALASLVVTFVSVGPCVSQSLCCSSSRRIKSPFWARSKPHTLPSTKSSSK